MAVLTRMLVLWLLAEHPLHGYRVRQALADDALGFWFAVEDASIYSCLKTLVKRRYARVAGRERSGRRPQRTRYAITPAGREHFAELLRRAWRELPPAGEPIALALAAGADLGAEEVRTLREERAAALESRIEDLGSRLRSAPHSSMVRRLLALTRAELRWLVRLRKEKA